MNFEQLLTNAPTVNNKSRYVLLTGDRSFKEQSQIKQLVDLCAAYNFTLVHGDCPSGADCIAKIHCENIAAKKNLLNLQLKFPADWKKYGKYAGPKRNQDMVNLKPFVCFAFHDSLSTSKGTKDTVNKCIKAKIPTYLINSKGHFQMQ